MASQYEILKTPLPVPVLHIQSNVDSPLLFREVDELSHVGLKEWEFQMRFCSPKEGCQLRSQALAPVCFVGNRNCRL